MKTGLLFVLLLGFGYVAPSGCSKKQASGEKIPAPVRLRLEQPKERVALFAPVGLIKKGRITA